MATLDFDPIRHPGLILNGDDLDAIRQKVKTVAWAKDALGAVRKTADGFLAQDVTIPDRKGQWGHYYSCKKDGTLLETVSPTEHKCPACGTAYTGEPYDSVVIRHRHMALTQGAIDLGLAYQLTGDQRYLSCAKRIVLGYADRYLNFPLVDKEGRETGRGCGRVFCTVLNESNWLTWMSWAYDLIAGELTDAERRHACDDMLHPAAVIVRRNRSRIHNIHCWMNSAFGCAALCCGDGELAYDAIRAEYGLIDQLKRGILDDGFWYECSWGYHFYTMSAVWPLTEAARQVGVDVYDDHYKAFFDLPLDFAFPGLYLPPLNDSGGGFFQISSRSEPYEIAYARWGDPRHAGLLELMGRSNRMALCFGKAELESAPPENRTSVDFPASGIAMLRDGADDPMLVTLDYGPHGGGHGHPDKLGLILYGIGRELAPDPGSINYAVPLHLEWFKTTLSHNTVLVDMQPQGACTGALHTFDVRDGIRIASASANDAYPGIGFRRTIALLDDGIVLDLCELDGDAEHTYDWVFHCRGDFSSDLAFESLDEPIGETHGYQHVYDPQRVDANDTWMARWTLDNGTVTLIQCGASGSEIFTGVGPDNPPPARIPMVISRRVGKRAVYASAFVVRPQAVAEVDLSVEMSDAAARFQICVDGDVREVALGR